MKTNVIVALAIGAIVSAVLLALEPLTDFALLSWEVPGITVAFLFLGAAGSSTFVGIAICWAVNALTYGLCTFAVLSIVVALKLLAAPKN